MCYPAYYISLVSLILAFLVGCKPGGSNSENKDDIAAIRDLQQTYQRGANTGDLDLFMSVWAEDAIRLEPDINYLSGKQEIREHFRASFEQFNVEVKVYGDEGFWIEGNLAYSHANFLLLLTPKGSDSTFHTDLKYLEIYEKQADGSWKIKIGSAMTNPQWSDEVLSPDMLKKEDTSAPRI